MAVTMLLIAAVPMVMGMNVLIWTVMLPFAAVVLMFM
jgi:hypothetical protein